MDFQHLDRALLPYEKILRAQEEGRKRIGVREVERPTYEKYITGPIERFDYRRNGFMALMPDNPYGEEMRRRFKERFGSDYTMPLAVPPYSELDPEDRIGHSLYVASRRLCSEYHPQPRSVTPSEGRLEVNDTGWMSRLIKKVALFLGAEMVRITRVDPRWVYQGVEIDHPYAIICAVSHPRSFNERAPSHFSGIAVNNTYSRPEMVSERRTVSGILGGQPKEMDHLRGAVHHVLPLE